MINRAQLKREAKLSMRGRRPNLFLVVLVYILIVDVLTILSFRLDYGMSMQEAMELIMSYDPERVYDRMLSYEPGFFGSLLSAAVGIMAAVLAAGFSWYCLRVSRKLEAGFGELFDGFGIFFKIWGLNIVMNFFIFLWSLLFVIPGIVAAYRYSMATFILLDDPDKPIMQCIRESKDMTFGHKTELFVLDLSFIGWNMLCAIPFVGVFVSPYYEISRANFYNVLSGWRPEPEQPVCEYDYKEPWEK